MNLFRRPSVRYGQTPAPEAHCLAACWADGCTPMGGGWIGFLSVRHGALLDSSVLVNGDGPDIFADYRRPIGVFPETPYSDDFAPAGGS
jgi:hypothetical protein